MAYTVFVFPPNKADSLISRVTQCSKSPKAIGSKCIALRLTGSKRPSKIINKLSFGIFFILIFTKSDVTKLNPPSIYCGQLSIFKYSQVLILYKTFLFRFLFETKNVSLCKNTEGFRKVFKSETISLIFIIFAICMKIEAV